MNYTPFFVSRRHSHCSLAATNRLDVFTGQCKHSLSRKIFLWRE